VVTLLSWLGVERRETVIAAIHEARPGGGQPGAQWRACSVAVWWGGAAACIATDRTELTSGVRRARQGVIDNLEKLHSYVKALSRD